MRDLLYVAIGDSLTVGFGAWPGRGFVPQYSIMAQSDINRRLITRNAGRIGATSEIIAGLFRPGGELPFLLQQADIITLTAGGNDLIHAFKRFRTDGNLGHFSYAMSRFQIHYGQIMQNIRQIKKETGPYMVRLVGLYNPYPGLPVGNPWVTRFNEHIRSFAGGGHTRMAEIYPAFAGREQELLSFDHLHPNSQGYWIIADQLRRLGYAPLA